MHKLLIAGLFGAAVLSAGDLYASGTADPVAAAAITAGKIILAQATPDDEDDDEDFQPNLQPNQNDQGGQGDVEDNGDDGEDTAQDLVPVCLA